MRRCSIVTCPVFSTPRMSRKRKRMQKFTPGLSGINFMRLEGKWQKPSLTPMQIAWRTNRPWIKKIMGASRQNSDVTKPSPCKDSNSKTEHSSPRLLIPGFGRGIGHLESARRLVYDNKDEHSLHNNFQLVIINESARWSFCRDYMGVNSLLETSLTQNVRGAMLTRLSDSNNDNIPS